MFTDASKYIYQATRRRAFFRNVTIIVPNAWTPHPQYGPLGYHNHDVIITPTNRHWAPDPYTKQYQGCGERAVSICIGADFITDPLVEEYYGSLGKNMD